MKKRLFIALFTIVVACLLAFSISAANEVTLTTGETVDFATVFKISSINWKGLDGVTTKVDNVVTGYNTGYTKNDIVHVTFPDEINGIECNGLFGPYGDSASSSIRTITFAATDTFFVNGDNMFSSYSVTKVTFNPNCVVDFRKGSFASCTSLTQITFPKFISLAGSAFKSCSNMVNTNDLVFAEGMTSIGGHAFNGCTSLTGTIYLPSSIETIGEYVFNNTGFTGVDFSKCSSLTVAGGKYEAPFGNMDNLTTLDMSGCTRLTVIRPNFAQGSDNLTEVILPPNLTAIPGKAFAQCPKLQSLVIPASCTSIGDEAFMQAGNSLTTKTFTLYIQSNVVFPSSGYGVFNQSNAKIEFVLFGNGVTVESFKAANASAKNLPGSVSISSLSSVDYMDPDNKWGYTVGGSISAHTIVYNYCPTLALTKSHSATDTVCGNYDYCTDCEYQTCVPHEGSISITYPNGYAANGRKDTCAVPNCNGNLKIVLKPIFKAEGYSIREKSFGIVSVYTVNADALAEFEALNGKLTVGIILANSTYIGQDSFMTKGEDGKYSLNTTKGIQVEIPVNEYSRIEVGVHNFTQDAADLNLVMSLYVVDDKGISYVQRDGNYASEIKRGDVTLDTVTILKIAELCEVDLPFTVPTPSGKED